MTEAPDPSSPRSAHLARQAAVATSHPLASDAAVQVLQEGGNAVDAAVVAAAVLAVTEPHMTGVGGDAFALLWWGPEGRLFGLDASGRSGSRATPESFAPSGVRPERGPRTVTVPGAPSGWAALLERFGTLSLAEALAPAIRVAEEGFAVTPAVAREWARHEDLLRDDAGAAATFLDDGGRTPRAGDAHRNPALARTFRRLAHEGPGLLYGGALGHEIVEGLAGRGGLLELDDLAAHEPHWVEPVSLPFRGRRIWELPPAGQGVAALQILGILEPRGLDEAGWGSARHLHAVVEASKLAVADLERWVADPEWMEVEAADLLDRAYLAERRGLVDPERAAPHPRAGAPVPRGDTVCLATADAHGTMVSFLNSLYGAFGSGVVIPGTGFALQNRGAGFVTEAGHPNRVAPRKRPLHTLIPAFVTRDGEPELAFGVMGGPMQPQGQAQVLLNHLLFGMELQAAVDAPRLRYLEGARVTLEGGLADAAPALESLGHEVVPPGEAPFGFGGAQAVLRTSGGWAAASDPRKDGKAAGY